MRTNTKILTLLGVTTFGSAKTLTQVSSMTPSLPDPSTLQSIGTPSNDQLPLLAEAGQDYMFQDYDWSLYDTEWYYWVCESDGEYRCADYSYDELFSQYAYAYYYHQCLMCDWYGECDNINVDCDFYGYYYYYVDYYYYYYRDYYYYYGDYYCYYDGEYCYYYDGEYWWYYDDDYWWFYDYYVWDWYMYYGDYYYYYDWYYFYDYYWDFDYDISYGYEFNADGDSVSYEAWGSFSAYDDYFSNDYSYWYMYEYDQYSGDYWYRFTAYGWYEYYYGSYSNYSNMIYDQQVSDYDVYYMYSYTGFYTYFYGDYDYLIFYTYGYMYDIMEASGNEGVEGAMTVADLQDIVDMVHEEWDYGYLTVLEDGVYGGIEYDAYGEEPYEDFEIEQLYTAEWTYGDLDVMIYNEYIVELEWEQNDDGEMEQSTYYEYFVDYMLFYNDSWAEYGYAHYSRLNGNWYDFYGEPYLYADGFDQYSYWMDYKVDDYEYYEVTLDYTYSVYGMYSSYGYEWIADSVDNYISLNFIDEVTYDLTDVIDGYWAYNFQNDYLEYYFDEYDYSYDYSEEYTTEYQYFYECDYSYDYSEEYTLEYQ